MMTAMFTMHMNTKLLHCTINNLKIHEPCDMYDNYSQNTCSRVCERVVKMVVVVIVLECDGEVPMNKMLYYTQVIFTENVVWICIICEK